MSGTRSKLVRAQALVKDLLDVASDELDIVPKIRELQRALTGAGRALAKAERITAALPELLADEDPGIKKLARTLHAQVTRACAEYCAATGEEIGNMSRRPR